MEQQERYPNLSALRAAHRQLLEHRRQDGKSAAFLDKVETFIRRGQATGALLVADEDRWNAQNLLDYWANELYHAHRDGPDATLADFDPELAPLLADDLCPYVGLDAFSSDKQAYFFGRDPLIAKMTTRLQESRVLILVGPSGSGKSSAALAGLLPRLQAGAVAADDSPGSETWRYYPPMMPGADPLANMARLIQPEKAGDARWVQTQIKRLRQSPDYLTTQIHQKGAPPAVLLIDQFEEVFTLCYNDKVRQAFINNLLRLLHLPAPRHTVILTLRSDFESILVQIPDLQTLFEQSQVRVTAMKASELRQAILKPAEKVGLVFEDGLVDELVREILGEPAALPLLQFTLLKLWESRDRNRVAWEAYRRLGGGRQALANSADAFYDALSPAEQTTARHILLRVLRLDDGRHITRDRILRQDLYKIDEPPERIDHVLERLIQARLLRLTTGAAPDAARVEIAHEALAHVWPQLTAWLEEDRVTRRRRLRLTAMAEEWQTRQHDPSALLRGLLLEEAATYDDLNKIEEAFVAASRQEAHRERLAKEVEKLEQAQALAEEQAQRAAESDRAAKRLRRLAIVLAAVFLIAVAAAISANINNRQARQNEAAAVANEQIANEQRTAAEASEATAVASEATASAARSAAQSDADLRATAEAEANRQRDAAETAANEAAAAAAIAETNAAEAEAQSRLAAARELASAAVNQLNSDPQLSLLLALEAVNVTYSVNQTSPAEAEDALYRALQASQLQRTLSGHTDGVRDVAFSADGSLMATAGLDTAVTVWDASSGQAQFSLNDAPRALNSVAFSPDGQHLAAAGADGFVYVWDLSSRNVIRALGGDGGAIRGIAYNQDGALLAAAMNDATVRVWDMTNGDALLRLPDHARRVNAVAFAPNGRQLASAGEDGRVLLWNLETGNAIYGIPAATTENGEPIAVNSLAFTSDGARLAAGLDNGTARLWQPQKPELIAVLSGHASPVFGVAFSPGGDFLVTASGDNTAKVWHTASGQVVYTLSGHSGIVSAIAISPDGTRLATASGDGTAKVWNAQSSLDVTNLTGHRAPVNDIAFGGDGRLIATGSDDKTVKIWNPGSGGLLRTIADPNNLVTAVAFSPDGTLLAAAGADNNAWVWDVETGQTAWVFQRHGGPLVAVRFSPDGRWLATAGEEGIARLWSLEDGRLLNSIEHGAPINGLAFSPDGVWLATAGDDAIAHIWQAASGAWERALTGHDGAVNGVAFNPAGSHLATASSDGTAKLWSLTNGELLRTLSGHTGPALNVAFSPDGTRLATASADKTARLWDASTGQALRTLLGHTSTVHSVAFSPDGLRLATASSDRTAQIIALTGLGELFSRGQSQVTRRLTQEECAQYLHGRPCLMEDEG